MSLLYQAPGPGSWLGRVWIPTVSILGVSRMLATVPWLCLQLSRPPPLGNLALVSRVTQVEIRAERRTQSWAIYGHTLGPQDPTPMLGQANWFVKSKPCIEHQLVCCPFIACSCGKGEGGPSSGAAWVSRGSSSFSGLKVDKCSFVEHIG